MSKEKLVKIIIILSFISLKSLPLLAKNDKVISLNPIIIHPKKSTKTAFLGNKNVDIITNKEIENTPVSSVGDILEFIPSVNIQKRGVYGVQSDISMRGGTFQQTLIMLNGIKVNDPQTGHHNLNLPITLEDIKKIEIIRGGSSSLFGADAFSGAINVITKKPKQEKSLLVENTLGEHSFSTQRITVSYPVGEFNNRLSFKRKESSGYKPETEFNIRTFLLNSSLEIDRGSIEYLMGYTDKDFGADSFYSDQYPKEEEHTNTKFFNVNANFSYPNLTLKPSIYYRRNQDKFILDRTRPTWYVNYHTTYTYGSNIKADIQLPFANISLGTKLRKEKIESTQLGNHSRDNQTLFLHLFPLLNTDFFCSFSFTEEHHENWGWETLPGVNVGYKINPYIKLRSAIERSVRIPSFTELYYDSPANKGNADLKMEENISYETGVDFKYKLVRGSLTIFKREGEDLIDWVRKSSSDPWKAKNIGKMDTYGIETTLEPFTGKLKKIPYLSGFSLGYTYLNSDKNLSGYTSKYALNYLEHHFSTITTFTLPYNISLTTKLSYKERKNISPYYMLDVKISKKKKIKDFSVEYFINGTNLLNTSYSEISGISMPGRWVKTGIKLNF